MRSATSHSHPISPHHPTPNPTTTVPSQLSFNNWLEAVFEAHGSRLYRVKGVLFFSGVDEPSAVQCVGSHIECERMSADEVEPGILKRRASRLVFIGRISGIEEELTQSFMALS